MSKSDILSSARSELKIDLARKTTTIPLSTCDFLTSMNPRYDSFDSLRAIACLLVIWQHVSESFVTLASGGLWMTQAARYGDFGRIGVIAFFCISGFVIPTTFRGARLSAIRNFLIGRFFRLYPIYWVSMLAGYFFVWQMWRKEAPLEVILKNLTMLATLLDAPLFMGLYWTLEVEIIFYLSCAGAYLIFGNLRLPVAAGAFVLCYLGSENNLLLEMPGNFPVLFYHLQIMFAATCFRCVYECYLNSDLRAFRFERISQTIALSLIGYLLSRPLLKAFGNIFPSSDPSWHQFTLGYSCGIALFLIAAVLPKTGRILPAIGRATYSAYLFHAVVFYAALKLWAIYDLSPMRMEFFVILCASATGAVAAVTYRFIELPSMRWAKRLRGEPAQKPLLQTPDARLGAP